MASRSALQQRIPSHRRRRLRDCSVLMSAAPSLNGELEQFAAMERAGCSPAGGREVGGAGGGPAAHEARDLPFELSLQHLGASGTIASCGVVVRARLYFPCSICAPGLHVCCVQLQIVANARAASVGGGGAASWRHCPRHSLRPAPPITDTRCGCSETLSPCQNP